MNEQIQSEEYYTLARVVKNGFIPWIKSAPTLRRIIRKQDPVNPKIVVIVEGEGTAKRYKIKGQSVIDFLSKVNTEGKI